MIAIVWLRFSYAWQPLQFFFNVSKLYSGCFLSTCNKLLLQVSKKTSSLKLIPSLQTKSFDHSFGLFHTSKVKSRFHSWHTLKTSLENQHKKQYAVLRVSRLSDIGKWTPCFKIYLFLVQVSSASSHHIWERKAVRKRNTEACWYNSKVYFHPTGQALQHLLKLNSQLFQRDFPLAWRILTSLWKYVHSSSLSNRKYYFLILPSVKLCKQNCESRITNAKSPPHKFMFGQWWIETYGLDVQCFSRQNTCWMHLLGAQWPGWSLLLNAHRGTFQPQSQEVWHGHMPASRGAEMGMIL